MDSMAYGTKHFEIFDAAEAGKYEEFMSLVSFATVNDLEWCLDRTNDLRIIKYIMDERNIQNFAGNPYIRAVENNRTDILNYFETHWKELCIKRLKSWIELFVKYETIPDETDPKYQSPIVDPNDDPTLYDKDRGIIDKVRYEAVCILNDEKEFILIKKRLALLEQLSSS